MIMAGPFVMLLVVVCIWLKLLWDDTDLPPPSAKAVA